MDDSSVPAGADLLFTIVPIVIGVIFVLIVVLIVVRVVSLRRKGLNPLTLDTDIAARVMSSDLLAAARPKAERLAELDALLASGAITPAEHATARATIIAGE
jgi:hypothetical protein